MNTQQLRCFIGVADHLSFTKAAKNLHYTTPTVTHHIQALEEELGTLLFNRNKRMVQLAPEGEIFYENAVRMLNEEKLALRHLYEHSQRQTIISV